MAQQGLHPEPVSAVRLQDLGAGVVVQRLPGQRVGDVAADVVVADAPGVRIAVGPLPHLGRGPGADAGEALQRPIRRRDGPASVRSSAGARTAVRTRVRLRRCSTPAARNRQLGTRAQACGVGGTIHPVRRRVRVGRRSGGGLAELADQQPPGPERLLAGDHLLDAGRRQRLEHRLGPPDPVVPLAPVGQHQRLVLRPRREARRGRRPPRAAGAAGPAPTRRPDPHARAATSVPCGRILSRAGPAGVRVARR